MFAVRPDAEHVEVECQGGKWASIMNLIINCLHHLFLLDVCPAKE